VQVQVQVQVLVLVLVLVKLVSHGPGVRPAAPAGSGHQAMGLACCKD